MKHLIYKNYWWLLLSIILLSVIYIYLKNIDLQTAIPLLAAEFSVFYFIQKQQLEEAKLFREIFSECNERYDSLNEALEELCSKSASGPLGDNDKKLLVDYFNLCGEEYIYYKQGYIYPSVWISWHNGMKYYMQNKLIKDFWQEEIKSNSYYGLSI